MWSHRLAADCGVAVPLHAAEHFYIVTEPIAGLPGNLPVLRVQDECAYYKEDAGKLLVGCFEPVAKPWGMQGIPEDFSFETLPEDYEHFEPILDAAMKRVPALADAGIQLFFNGPESFTPDDRYYVGETPEVRDLFVATGFNSIGIQSSGGVGKVLAQWIVDRHPPVDLADVDIRRVMPFQANRRYLRDRTVETLGLLYAMHWPYYQYQHRARRTAHPAARPAGRRRRLHGRDGRAGSGRTGLPRPARAPLRVFLRPAELVRGLRRGMRGDARCRRALRPVLLRQIPGAGSRRLRVPEPYFHRRRRRARRAASSTRSGSMSAAASRPT